MSSSSFDGFPWRRQTPWELPEMYRRLRDQAPVAKAVFSSGQPVWLVSTHDLVREVLTSPYISSEHSNPAFPGVFPVRQRRSENGERPKLTYSGMDGREHSSHRRMVAPDFSRAAADKFRHSVKIAAALQAADYAGKGPPADLVTGFARPLVARTIGTFLGLSAADTAECARLTDVVLGSGADTDAVECASRGLRSVVSELLKEKTSVPSADLLGRLVTRYVKAGMYDHDQMVRFAASLITAGLETTANMISLSVMTLLEYPHQLAALRSDRSLLPNAVRELLRYLSVADIVTARVAVAEVHLGEFTIPEGAGVVALTASANRDATAFHDPDTLDIRRRADHHLAFGHGSHKCLGQHVATVILECAVGALLHQFESIRLSPLEPNNGQISAGVMCGVDRLSLAWNTA